jgi:pilus assembly protein Flp/PilA
MREFITRFMSDDSGATAIEYGLIATGIAIAIIAAVTAVGSALDIRFTAVATALSP